MLRRTALIAACVATLLAAAPAAHAKGPIGATIEGEGVTGTLDIDEPGELGQFTAMSELVEAAGFFTLALGDGSAASEAPTSSLGQPLMITWRMGDGVVVEEIYLHAAGGPVAHVAPGQLFWEGTAASNGGWLRITGDIATPLVALGVPEAAVAHLRPDVDVAPAPVEPTTAHPASAATKRPTTDRSTALSSPTAASAATGSRSVAVGLLAAVALGGTMGLAAWRSRRSPRTH